MKKKYRKYNVFKAKGFFIMDNLPYLINEGDLFILKNKFRYGKDNPVTCILADGKCSIIIITESFLKEHFVEL